MNYFKKTRLNTFFSSLLLASMGVVSCTSDIVYEEELESSGVNRLSNKSVELSINALTASEQQSRNPVSNATDGDITTRWSGFGDQVELIIELDQPSKVDYLNIAYYKGNERRAYFAYQYSEDGHNWVGSKTKTSSGTTADFEIFDLANSTEITKYVKIICGGNTVNDWNSISEIEVYGIPQVTVDEAPSVEQQASSVDVPTGSNPWDFYINCNQWKITYIDGSEQKQLCDQGETPEYYVSDDGKALVFEVTIDESTSSTRNSQYIRSELREREEDGSKDIYWTTDGDHALYINESINRLNTKQDNIVAGQIHGNKDEGIDDSMVLRLEGKHMFLSFNGGNLRDHITITENYQLGDKFEVIFRIINGKHYCYFSTDGKLRAAYNSGNADQYLITDNGSTVLLDLDYDETYFKVGNYSQTNYSVEGSAAGPNNYSQVYVYAFNVSHDGGAL